MAIAGCGPPSSGIAVVTGISDNRSFTYPIFDDTKHDPNLNYRISDNTKHHFNLKYLAD
jgi:hypothetical protein